MRRGLVASAALTAACLGATAHAQQAGWGRFSLFLNTWQQRSDQGFSSQSNELIGTVSLRSPDAGGGGTEYSVDARGSTYPGGELGNSVSIYQAWVGGWTQGGRLGLRLGQMWLTELGGLGSLGGALVQLRQAGDDKTGRFRLALFGGLEPQPFEAGFVPNVKKAGGFVSYDGPDGRQNVLGYVLLRNGGLTERSVLTTYNFVPSGRTFFIYQNAEYDLQGPGGQGKGGLNYFFTTARYAPTQTFEVVGMFHRGISVDTRSITNDELAGHPVDPRALQGFLFESADLRFTAQLSRKVRVWVGIGRDRSNLDDQPDDRAFLGFSTFDIGGSGFDFTATDSKIDRSTGGYHSTYLSVGKSLGSRVYLSADYTTSLSVFQFTGTDGVTVTTSPRSKRYALSATINASRTFSFLVNAEHLVEVDSHENRLLTGIVVRF